MTRPRVPDDKRQRTAQACDICKRRKQKCNGKRPCSTCIKRHLGCKYTNVPAPDRRDEKFTSPTKRKFNDEDDDLLVSPDTQDGAVISLVPSSSAERDLSSPLTSDESVNSRRLQPSYVEESLLGHRVSNFGRLCTSPEPDEEAQVPIQPRMLQDPTGRLQYVGDSATLSYLQLIRMIVDNAIGSSKFTQDPSRHKIMEATFKIPAHVSVPAGLPDRRTASILVDAFFTNTQGLIEVLDHRDFRNAVDACYAHPRTVNSSAVCLLYLTLAIGLVLATPIPNSFEDSIIKKLRAERLDRAEVFFRNAKELGDPVSGFGDADLWSIQALTLMCVYTLAISKRNLAWSYHGMAVRTAFSLGLHRMGDATVIFSEQQVALRRNLWRSLFVLDRFLAASLGRPLAINEDDCSEDSLETPKSSAQPTKPSLGVNLSTTGLDAAVKTCQSIGHILRRIYSKRKFSTKQAQEIAGECESWTRRIHPDLDLRRLFNGTITAAQGMTILHVQLLACHSIILLTRPFFLYLLIKSKTEPKNVERFPPRRTPSRLERFSEECVESSVRTVALIQTAYQSNYLPQRNPFVLYCLFAAALVILSNEVANVHRNKHYLESTFNCITIMRYCAQTDVQADRLLYILDSFQAVVEHQKGQNEEASSRKKSIQLDVSQGNMADRMAHLARRKFTETLTNGFADGVHPATGHIPQLRVSVPMQSLVPAPKALTTLAPDDRGASPNGVSPASSRDASSGSRSDPSGRFGREGELSAEQEFDFDSFWDFPRSVSAAGQMQGLVTAADTHAFLGPHMSQPEASDATPLAQFQTYLGFHLPSQTPPMSMNAHSNGSAVTSVYATPDFPARD